MDFAELRSELEQHLKRNPHDDAPGGFRDRFDQAVEHHAAEDDSDDKADLEEQLRRIVREAEAAADAACSDGRDGDSVGTGPAADRAAPAAGPGRTGKRRMGVVVAAIAAAAAAAFYFYSGSS